MRTRLNWFRIRDNASFQKLDESKCAILGQYSRGSCGCNRQRRKTHVRGSKIWKRFLHRASKPAIWTTLSRPVVDFLLTSPNVTFRPRLSLSLFSSVALCRSLLRYQASLFGAFPPPFIDPPPPENRCLTYTGWPPLSGCPATTPALLFRCIAQTFQLQPPPPLLSSTRTFSNAQCCNKFTNLAVRICARSVFNSLKNPAICGIPLVITSRNDKFYDYAYSDQVLLFQFPQLSDWVRFGECSFTKSTKKLIS